MVKPVFSVRPNARKYLSKFVDYDGTIISEVVVKDGEAIVLPENPTKEEIEALEQVRQPLEPRSTTYFEDDVVDFEYDNVTVAE